MCWGSTCTLPQPDHGLSVGLLNMLLSSGLGSSCQVLDCHVTAKLGWGHLAVLLLLCLILSLLPGPYQVLGFLAVSFLCLALVKPFLVVTGTHERLQTRQREERSCGLSLGRVWRSSGLWALSCRNTVSSPFYSCCFLYSLRCVWYPSGGLFVIQLPLPPHLHALKESLGSPASSPQGRSSCATVALTSASHHCTAHSLLPYFWKW